MSAQDDPEARIRELERSLNDQAAASELGASQSGGNTAHLPPPIPGYSPSEYGGQPYGTQFRAPRRRSSGGIPWLVFALIVLVIAGIATGVAVVTDKLSTVSGGPTIDIPSIPSLPNFPSTPSPPGAPVAPQAPGVESEVQSATPDAPASVSGIDNNKTIDCVDGSVTVSGIRNTVNITGHCVNVSVSGMNNVVTVEVADVIGASGFDNRVTFHSGTPQINNAGSNVVEQG